MRILLLSYYVELLSYTASAVCSVLPAAVSCPTRADDKIQIASLDLQHYSARVYTIKIR